MLLGFVVTLQSYSQTDSTKKKWDTTSDTIFMKVEIAASISRTVWKDYLTKATTPYIERAREEGIPNGTYSVNVKFLVEVDGSITDVMALNDPGYGLGSGAVKIMRNSPKWDPCIQNGRKVRSYRTQAISFVFP